MPEFSLGAAIYIAIKPLFKIYLSAGTGFLLAKQNVLTPEGTRIISLIILNYLLPCLIFSNIVESLKDTDIKIMGVIILTGYMYYALGGVWGFLTRFTCPMPKSWFGGILMACIFNNCSDLPIAYVQTLGNGDQFPSDSTRVGTAYCVVFSIVFISGLFNLGGQRLLIWDAQSGKEGVHVPPLSIDNVKKYFAEKRAAKANPDLEKAVSRTSNSNHSESDPDHEQPLNIYHDTNASRTNSGLDVDPRDLNASSDVISLRPSRTRSITGSMQTGRGSFSSAIRPSFTDTASTISIPEDAISTTSVATETKPEKNRGPWGRFKHHHWSTFFLASFVEDMRRPQALTLLVALPIAMIPWTRRLFVDDPDQIVKGIPNAPDGQPVLDFIMNYTQFFGAAQVPLGLMLLGGTMARLKIGNMVKGFWKTILMAVALKLVILPIIAVLWITKLKNMNWIDPNNSMAAVVLSVTAATPSATVQIYLTTLLSDPNKECVELNCLAICLIIQYMLLPISMSILVTYVLKNVI